MNWTACLMASSALMAPQLALAQDAGPPAELETIVVTAQKKAENVQSVPITMTAIGGEALRSGGLRDVEQISKLTPGLYVGKFDTLRPQVYLRGIGSRVFDPGSEGSVGIFVDESYVGRFSGSLADILDADRVEVLKGPQGTLYGRNTIAGAINIVTRAPTPAFEANVEATAGNYGQYAVQGVISGPLNDAVRVRLAARTNHRDGYALNTLTGAHGNDDDGDTVRARLQADLSPNLVLDLIGEYQGSESLGLFQKSTGTRQFFQAATSPSYTPNPDRYADAYNTDGSAHRRLHSTVGKLAWNGEAVSVTGITSYRTSDIGQAYDVDATPRDVWTFNYGEKSKQFSQELRVGSIPGGPASFGGAVSWVAGVYYYREHTRRTDHFDFGPDSIFATGQPTPEHNTYGTDIKTESFAAFGQATWSPTDTLNITLGGRFTHDSKDAVIVATTDSTTPPAYNPGFTVSPSKSWKSFDPKITIDYHLTPKVMAYAIASHGFKSGGFQYNATSAALAGVVFDPEKVWAYEAGLKSQLLDNRVQLNVAAFYYDYSNLQLPRFVLLPPPAAPGSGSNIISNAAKSTVKGVDVTVAAALARGLTVSGGVSYLDAAYDDYVTGTTSFSGNTMIRSPKWQASATINYETPVSESLKVRLRADWSYTSRIFFEADEGARPFTSQAGYGLVNLRAGLAEIDERWALEAFVNNVGDKHYVTNIFAVPVTVLQTWSIPRTYGATVRHRF